jgi:hypothetical protein
VIGPRFLIILVPFGVFLVELHLTGNFVAILTSVAKDVAYSAFLQAPKWVKSN